MIGLHRYFWRWLGIPIRLVILMCIRIGSRLEVISRIIRMRVGAFEAVGCTRSCIVSVPIRERPVVVTGEATVNLSEAIFLCVHSDSTGDRTWSKTCPCGRSFIDCCALAICCNR